MSLHDKNLIFFNKTALAAALNTKITSKIVDLRYNGDDVDCRLFIRATLGAKPTGAGAAVKTEVMTSANGTNWTKAAEYVSDGEKLVAGPLPHGLKRYVRLECTVTTALGEANTVFAEITDAVDSELDQKKVQEWKGIPSGGSVPEGMENLAKTGDTVTAP